MTTEYLIHPIPLIVLETDMPKMTHLQNYGQKVDILIYVWYLEGGPQEGLCRRWGNCGNA